MLIREIMSKSVTVIPKNLSAKEAADIMKRERIGSLPVREGDRLVGMLTDRDLALRIVAEGKDPNVVQVSDCMSSGVKYCYDDESIENLSQKMGHTRYRRLPVLNREKRLVGIVSVGDLALHETAKSTTLQTLQGICRSA